MKFIKQFLMIGILGLLSSQANAITIGIGYHLQAEDPVAVADLLLKNNIKHVRVDSGTDILTSSLLPQVQAFYNKGIQVTVIIHTSTEAKLHVGENQIGFNSVCPGDQITIENTSKNEAVIQVNALKNYVTDFEILNEPSLVNNVFGQSLVLAPFQSVTPSPGNYSSQYLYQENYRTPCGFTIKAIIRGVYKAVKYNSF